MKSHGFTEIDHTADLALRAWGENFHVLLKQAAEGLYYLLNVESNKAVSIEHSFSIELDAREAMLVDFLNELLFLCQEKGKRFHRFSFSEFDGWIQVNAEGHLASSMGRSIKAVTFHELQIQENASVLETTITFDV